MLVLRSCFVNFATYIDNTRLGYHRDVDPEALWLLIPWATLAMLGALSAAHANLQDNKESSALARRQVASGTVPRQVPGSITGE